MENLFENEYTMETNYFKEYVYNVLCKKTICTGVIIGVIGILFFIMVHSVFSYITLTAGVIAFLSAIFTPMVSAKELEKAAKRLNNGNIEKTNVKFLNNIVMDEGKVHLEVEFSQITEIVQTKNFIVLKTSEQSAVLVLKNGFIKGNENDFMKFIEEKIKKCKLK